MQLPPHPSAYSKSSLLDRGILPDQWRHQVIALIRSSSIFVHLDGTDPTAREEKGSQGTDYYVVPGNLIKEHLTWLYDLYHTKLTLIASAMLGRELKASSNVRAGININVLAGRSTRYEWHVDSNPVSGVLFVTTQAASEGGALSIKAEEHTYEVLPRVGDFVLFRAGELLHGVTPLLQETARISIPMLFYFAEDTEQDYPPDLDDYLYKEAAPSPSRTSLFRLLSRVEAGLGSEGAP